MKTSREIRNTFLGFFSQKLHQIVPSAPIVVKNDPTLMFTNAGMNPFKDIFLGLKNPAHRRVADTQKCLRVSGKHNDLEEVGHDTYHHTMFEMLGNWSFGDYYKDDAIAWAWELLTTQYQLAEDRLYATVFGGDPAENLSPDEEARQYWLRFLPAERILPGSKKDNFWEMGETGPCGPCSEIHVDLRSEEERRLVDGAALVNTGHPQVVEIWNLVFIQYNRKADQSLEELPAKHVDTGMGFERLTMALQGKTSTYDTDIFDNARTYLERKTGLTYQTATHIQQVSMRVIMDHIRAIVFTIADGQIPSNTGAGYVIRRILRRASRYAYAYLGLTEPFLYEMVALMAADYGHVFPEVPQQEAFIVRIIQEEEKGFLRKLADGTRMFEAWREENPHATIMDGTFAFRLLDTFGFPKDLTQLMAREAGLDLDLVKFEEELEIQRTRSRKATETATGDWVVLRPFEDLPRFVGYDLLEIETSLLQYRTVTTAKGALYQVVLEETPFYAESGGQVGDQGLLSCDGETLRVLDTKKENGLIIHFTDKLPVNGGGSWTATVDASRRRMISANHSATHLLHAILREELGTHVEQRGSLVSQEALRFDFSHFARVSEEELARIEARVNEKIMAAIPLTEYRDMPIEQAKAMGAMALFGEKYGDAVRVVIYDPAFSVELCGGTHVRSTSDIRLFKLVSEGSAAAGIRRIEALTGETALSWLNDKLAQYQRIAALLKNPPVLEKALEDLMDRNRALEKSLQQLQAEKLQQVRAELSGKFQAVGNVQMLAAKVDVASADDLKQLSFDLKRESARGVIVLGAVIQDKPLLSVILGDDLAASKTYDASALVRTLAQHIQGGGGGQPFYATAGGKNVAGLDAALAAVSGLL